MWRTVCKAVSLLTACAILLGVTAGCGRSEEEQCRRLFEKGIAVENNITIENLPDDTAADCTAYYLRIDGLKDQAVEDRINGRIREVLEELRDPAYVPPYRGIALKFRDCGDAPKRLDIYFDDCFNCNNILSVNANCHVLFRTEANDDVLFSYMFSIPMNFDLTTGQELALKDLFSPGTDYIELVNRAVDQCLMKADFDGSTEEYGEYSQIKLVSPFRTVKPGQKFRMNEDGSISLYIDYDTPEFQTDYYRELLSLPVDAFGSAYMPFRAAGRTAEIYESEEIQCRFLYDYSSNRVEQSNDSESDWYYGIYKYRDGTPEAVIRQIDALTFEWERLPLGYEDFRKRAAKEIGKKKGMRLSAMVTTNHTFCQSDGYYGFTRQVYLSAETEDDPEPKYYSLNYRSCRCFDSNGNPVDVRSLFVDPDKADALLENAIAENIYAIAKEDGSAPELSDEQIRSLIRRLLPHIDGVAPEAASLNISYDMTDAEIDGMIKEWQNAEEPDDAVRAGLMGAKYSDLGCGNLVFFRDVFA